MERSFRSRGGDDDVDYQDSPIQLTTINAVVTNLKHCADNFAKQHNSTQKVALLRSASSCGMGVVKFTVILIV